ncbi:MAG: hypothetical protein U9R03_03575, partial [Candidatus Aerophobetes bacterium]|nr:hypothetical protein [Candidatus Aerophobetes bacterium]
MGVSYLFGEKYEGLKGNAPGHSGIYPKSGKLLTRMTGRFSPELVAGFLRNGWQVCTRIYKKGQDESPREVKSFKILLEIKKEKLERAKLTDGLCCFITNH